MANLPKYRSPPLVEVVCGFVFETLRAVKGPHFGLFWHEVLENFPKCDQAAPLGLEENLTAELDSVFPLPRMWLISRDGDRLVQLQRDRFYFNWRTGANRVEYCGFDEIYPSFLGLWDAFQGFLRRNELGEPALRSCELTYINHITQATGWSSMGDVTRIFPTLGWRAGQKGFLPLPRVQATTAVYDLPDQLSRLNLRMQPGQATDSKENILVLELSAKGPPGGKLRTDIDSWFQVAHEWIVRGFEDLVEETIQEDILKRI